MEAQQLWLIVSAMITVIILTVTIIITIISIIFIINSRILKNRLQFKDEKQWYEIAIAGSIILATGQLIGSLCSVMFPIWFGPDVSDYGLSCYPINYSYEYNSNSTAYYDNKTATASAALIFISKIYASDLHPLRQYNREIYLNITSPRGLSADVSEFVIKPNQNANVYVYTYNKSELYPGRYAITVHGIGEDGKTRDCKLFLDVYKRKSFNNSNISIRSTSPNLPPAITSMFMIGPRTSNGVITIKVNAADPEGDPILYRFFLNGRPVTNWMKNNTWMWKTSDNDVGTNIVEAEVTDGKHASSNEFDHREIEIKVEFSGMSSEQSTQLPPQFSYESSVPSPEPRL